MKEYDTDKQLNDIMREIEEKQRRLINDYKKDAYTDSLWTFVHDRPKNYNRDGLSIVDIATLWKTLDFIRDNTADFSRDDIPRIIDAIPSFTACLRDYPLEKGGTMTALRFVVVIAERVGHLPVERYIDRHHAKKGTDRENAIESIELTRDLITAFMGIDNETLKALVIDELLGGLPFLEKKEGRASFGGFDLFYDEMSKYTDKDLKEMEDTFKRRDELPKDNAYRRDFVNQYIDSEVCNRFYSDDYTLKYTPELGKAWDEHFNELCEEYNESEYKRNYTEKDYKAVRCDLLCHYPVSWSRAGQKKDALHYAQKHGIDTAIIDRAGKLKEDAFLEIKDKIDEVMEK